MLKLLGLCMTAVAQALLTYPGELYNHLGGKFEAFAPIPDSSCTEHCLDTGTDIYSFR